VSQKAPEMKRVKGQKDSPNQKRAKKKTKNAKYNYSIRLNTAFRWR
jgi:hypothetical protein